jgi:hypothetical protein
MLMMLGRAGSKVLLLLLFHIEIYIHIHLCLMPYTLIHLSLYVINQVLWWGLLLAFQGRLTMTAFTEGGAVSSEKRWMAEALPALLRSILQGEARGGEWGGQHGRWRRWCLGEAKG